MQASEATYIREKGRGRTSLDATQGSLKTAFESPGRVGAEEGRAEKLEREKEWLEKDCSRLREQISQLERKAEGAGADHYSKRIEKLEGDVKNLANVLEEWSTRTSKIPAY